MGKWKLLIVLSFPVFASPVLDEQYALKSMGSFVIAPATDPLYAEQVEKQIADFFSENTRFDFVAVKTNDLMTPIKKLSTPYLSVTKPINLGLIRNYLKDLSKEKLHGIFLAQLIKNNESYDLIMALINVRTQELVHVVREEISNTRRLDSFGMAAKRCLKQLIDAIPFQASLLSREGYRVVLDRGVPEFRRGMQFSAHTIELNKGEVTFVETGKVVITRAEKNISFGKIIADRHPLVVAPGNKLRGSGEAIYADGLKLLESQPNRTPSSIAEEAELSRGTYGYVDLDLATSDLSISNSPTTGLLKKGEGYLPGGRLMAELFATGRIFADFGFSFAASDVSILKKEVNSAVSEFRMQGGYRLLGVVSAPGPSLDVQLGFAHRRFRVDPTGADPILTSATYNGILVGSRARYPLGEEWGVGFNVNAWLFSSVTEDPQKSGGTITGVSGWDLGLEAFYHYSRPLDLMARLALQNNAAEFKDKGDRALDYFSISQSTRILSLGMSYFF